MPPKRTTRASNGPSSAVGSALTPGKRPRGQKINEGLPPIGTAISSSYGSGMSMTPKDLGRFQGTAGRGLSNTLAGAMNRRNLYDRNEPIIFADAPQKATKVVEPRIEVQEEVQPEGEEEEEEQEQEQEEEVDPFLALGRGRGRGPPIIRSRTEYGQGTNPSTANAMEAWGAIARGHARGQGRGRGQGQGGQGRGKLPSDVDRTFGQESDIHGDIGIQETPRAPTAQSPAHFVAPQISLAAQLREFWATMTGLIRRFVGWVMEITSIAMAWTLYGAGKLLVLVTEPMRVGFENIATGLNHVWRFLQKSWKPLLLILLSAYAATLVKSGEPSDSSMNNDVLENEGAKWNIRSFGWDMKRNIGQLIPYPIAHPISYLSDPDVRKIEERLTNLEYDVAHLQSLQSIDHKGIKVLEKKLPDKMALHVGSDGKPQISTDFWKSIKSQPLWEDYLQRVEGIVDSKMSQSLGKEVDQLVLETLKNYEVMNKQKVIDLIQHRYEADLENIRKQFYHVAHLQSELGVQLEAVASVAENELLSRSTYGINWFTFRTGAIVDATNTSPTYMYIDSRTSFIRRTWLKFIGRPFSLPKPPITALESWSEDGDCWCSPSNTSDPENFPPALTVMLGQNIYPQHVIIEHPPQSTLLDPGATPMNFEIHAFIPGIVANELATLLSAHMFTSHAERPFGNSFVKIAEFIYDPHGGSNIQAFPMQVNLKDVARYDAETSTNRIVVRMLDNWGEDMTNHTCLYRARMYGESRD